MNTLSRCFVHSMSKGPSLHVYAKSNTKRAGNGPRNDDNNIDIQCPTSYADTLATKLLTRL